MGGLVEAASLKVKANLLEQIARKEVLTGQRKGLLQHFARQGFGSGDALDQFHKAGQNAVEEALDLSRVHARVRIRR